MNETIYIDTHQDIALLKSLSSPILIASILMDVDLNLLGFIDLSFISI